MAYYCLQFHPHILQLPLKSKKSLQMPLVLAFQTDRRCADS